MRSKDDKQRPEIVIGGGTSCINFEFQKGKEKKHGTSQHRTTTAVSGKPTPSKWDDAQKWLVNLSKHQSTETPRDSNADDLRLITAAPKKEDYYSSDEENDKKSASQMIQVEVETKKVDCNESIWRINNISEVHLRDMGTEMSPGNSQEPSRSVTPIRARNVPVATSHISSGSSSPDRDQNGVVQAIENGHVCATNIENRGEICRGNAGEAAIATEIGVKKDGDQYDKKMNPLETRAMAWDESERAKYSARYKREEVKIQAWENHEKRKAEMEMRRMEVKAERIKARAQEKYINKIAAARRIAEEKRANAEAKLNEKAVETSEKADHIRRTGHLPSYFSFKLPSFCW